MIAGFLNHQEYERFVHGWIHRVQLFLAVVESAQTALRHQDTPTVALGENSGKTRTNPLAKVRFFYVLHRWGMFVTVVSSKPMTQAPFATMFFWSSWNLIGACGQGPSGDDGGTDLFVQKMSEASELPTATCDGWTLVLFVKLGCQRLETKGGEIMHNHILYIQLHTYYDYDIVYKYCIIYHIYLYSKVYTSLDF